MLFQRPDVLFNRSPCKTMCHIIVFTLYFFLQSKLVPVGNKVIKFFTLFILYECHLSCLYHVNNIIRLAWI